MIVIGPERLAVHVPDVVPSLVGAKGDVNVERCCCVGQSREREQGPCASQIILMPKNASVKAMQRCRYIVVDGLRFRICCRQKPEQSTWASCFDRPFRSR